MKKIYTYLAMFVAAATMVACENAPEGNVTPDATGKPIEITIGAQNRALLNLTDGKSVTWEADDQIGLFHTIDGSVSENCKNEPYTADAAGATATFTGDATWGDKAEGTHNFYVYYPYRSDKCDDPTALVKTLTNKQTYDVTGDWDEFGAKYSFAYAKVENVAYGDKVVFPDALKQLFCILRLTLTNNTGSDITISQVTVESDKTNIRRPYTIDITKDPATTTGEGTKLITCTVQNGTVANGNSVDIRVALGAEDYSSDTFTIVVTSNMGVHPAVTFTGKKLGQGERASKSITIEAAPTSKYKIGDIVDGGVLFWMSDDKKTGKVVCGQGQMAILNFSTEGLKTTKVSDGNADEGDANIAKIKEYATTNSLDFATSFPAPSYCDELKGDWYLPARNELKALFAAYVGRDDWSATSDLPDTTGSETGDAWMGTEAARNAFNAALNSAPIITKEDGTANDYNLTAIPSDNLFALSSTETSEGKTVWLVKFNIRYETNSNKYAKSTKRIVRCIKRVDLTE